MHIQEHLIELDTHYLKPKYVLQFEVLKNSVVKMIKYGFKNSRLFSLVFEISINKSKLVSHRPTVRYHTPAL